MSKFSRTLSFMKRNGVLPTIYAAMERLGWWNPDPEQILANAYYGPAERTEYVKVAAQSENIYDSENSEQKKKQYKISIVVPAYETNVAYFKEMVDSVCSQTYTNWQLIIADASKNDCLENIIEEYEDARICYLRLKENKGISENTNEALKYADGDYIGLLDHDDTLDAHALAEIVDLLQNREYELIYTDEDKINEDGTTRFEPNFKPDFNFDFLLSNNYICHFTVLSKRLMDRLAFRPAFNGAQDYDLFLQAIYELEQMRSCESENRDSNLYIPYAAEYLREKIGHIPKVLYHWRAHMASTADNPESKRYAYEAGKRALENFVARNGWTAEVEHTKHLGFYEINYKPDIFSVRKDVVAVCGKKVRFGKVLQGPVVDGKELFRGMNAKYSGYMHKAVLKFDVDNAPKDCIRIKNDVTSDDLNTGRIVYVPDFDSYR